MESDPLEIDCRFVEKTLTEFIRTETDRAGMSGVVVGISGGVDSAVSAALAATSLGQNRVLGVFMPHRTSSPESGRDAHLVADHLGIELLTVDITAMADSYLDTVSQCDNIRRGNVLARSRMIVLYDQSAERDALVLGTGNKTERMLGYTTLWGDMASAINPIGDLYKTQVWQLAADLPLPKPVVDKPASADLWPGQTDEAELGFSYREADLVLHHFIDRGCRAAELERMGFDPQLIRSVIERVEQTEFKRRMPLIPSLADPPRSCRSTDGER